LSLTSCPSTHHALHSHDLLSLRLISHNNTRAL
jgi:hypothetical protein